MCNTSVACATQESVWELDRFIAIALSLIIAWMWQDARERGVSAMPYVLLTLGFGSVGPLLYLLLRRDGARDRLAVRAGAPVRAAL